MNVDHVEAAKQSLSSAEGFFWQDYDGPTYVALCIADAQAHATLALVEQQRLANLLTVMRMESAPDEVHQFGKGIQLAVDRLWPDASEWEVAR